MQQTLATILLIVAANQANAEGFYQMITADHQSAATAGIPGTVSDPAPLHQRVLEGSGRIALQETPAHVPEWNYSPLYLRVTGTNRKTIDRRQITVGTVNNPAGR